MNPGQQIALIEHRFLAGRETGMAEPLRPKARPPWVTTVEHVSAALKLHPTAPAELPPDREVMSRVARGEAEAFRALYQQYAPQAMAIASRILRSQPDAEDVVQETFAELWRRSDQFDRERGSAAAWITTIVRSRAIDRLRLSGTAERVLDAGGETLAPTDVMSPAEVTEGRLDETRVATALAALPPAQRETIQLAYFEGLTQNEIATRTGSPLGTVKMRVKLAIAKLAALLKEDEV